MNPEIKDLGALYEKAKELFADVPLSLSLVEWVADTLYLLTSGKRKERSEQVCQIILRVLDDVEKVERVLRGGSTEITNSIEVSVADCKNFVNNHLPVILGRNNFSCLFPWCSKVLAYFSQKQPVVSSQAPPVEDPVVLEPK
jgi:hypothetical protein